MAKFSNKLWNTELGPILFAAACAFIVMTLLSCSGNGTSTSEATASPLQPRALSSDQIFTWGDSATSGIGASNPALSYPAQLQTLTGRNTFNGGVSAQTSDQIAARQGGAPALLTLPNNTLPPTGTVIIESQSTFPISVEGPGPIAGTIGEFHGTLNYQTNSSNVPQLTFSRDGSGMLESIPAQSPFHPDTFGSEAQINVFWMGQNNFYDPEGVKRDIVKCIAFLPNKKFIVMSLLNSVDAGIGTDSYDQLAQINADLAQAYPDNFLDIRKLLIGNYDPNNPQDVQDHKIDVLPSTLRNDNEHPNDKGYGIVAQQVAVFIEAKHW